MYAKHIWVTTWLNKLGIPLQVGLESCSQWMGGKGMARNRKMSCSTTKMHQCPFCQYSTAVLTNLNRHVRTHTGEKPFACPHCPYTCTQKENLKTHIRTHTGEKPYACPYCPYRSSRTDSLKNHMYLHQT